MQLRTRVSKVQRGAAVLNYHRPAVRDDGANFEFRPGCCRAAGLAGAYYVLA